MEQLNEEKLPSVSKRVYDPERLRSSKQDQSREVGAGQAEQVWDEPPPDTHPRSRRARVEP